MQAFRHVSQWEPDLAIDDPCCPVMDVVARWRPPQVNVIPLGIDSPRLNRANCAVITFIPCAFKWREFAKHESSRVAYIRDVKQLGVASFGESAKLFLAVSDNSSNSWVLFDNVRQDRAHHYGEGPTISPDIPTKLG